MLELAQSKSLPRHPFELLVVPQFVGSDHAEGAPRHQLALLLDRLHRVAQSILLRVVLGLNLLSLLRLAVIFLLLDLLLLLLGEG